MKDVTALCDAVMRGVVRAIPAGTTIADTAEAVTVMRAEIKALLTGADYADARDCVMRGSLHDGYVIGLVVANCLGKITLRAA